MLISGTKLAEAISTRLKKEVTKLTLNGITPKLAVILIGDNPASLSYIKRKTVAGAETGINVELFHYPDTVTDETIREKIAGLNADNKTHGIIIQRPLPPVSEVTPETLTTVNPTKDVDGFIRNSPYEIPVAAAVREILAAMHRAKSGKNPYTITINIPDLEKILAGKKVVVIGRGETAGRPVSAMLKKANVIHQVITSQTPDPHKILRKSDVVVSCVGKPDIVRREYLKSGCWLISVGISKSQDNKLTGDYDEAEIADLAAFYTPTPGGVGPVNVACLMENIVAASKSV